MAILRSYLWFIGTLFFGVTRIALAAESCNAIQLSREGSWNAAVRCAESQRNPLLLKITLWSKYSDRSSNASTEEILNFVSDNPHFPDSRTLQAIAETKINDRTSTRFLKRWFATHPPITDVGIKHYFHIMEDNLNDKDLALWAKKYWVKVDRDKKERRAFLAKHGKYLSHSDHVEKLNHLIELGYTRVDNDLLDSLDNDHKELFKARLKMLRNNSHINIKSTIAKVPQHLRSSTNLLYAQAIWHEKNGQYSKIAQLILDHPNVKNLKTDDWFKLRSRTALELAQKGQHKTSYAIASDHNYQNPVNYVDGEWLAGKTATTHLQNHKLALQHFENILNHAKYPVSIAKSAYWCGMMCLKLGMKDQAKQYFDIASKHIGTFYGQLALTKKKIYKVQVPDTKIEATEEDHNWFKKSELVKASLLFAQDSQYILTRKFANAAYNAANTPGKQYLLTTLGPSQELPNLSVAYNKISERHGFFSPEYSYPTISLQPASDSQTDPALVYAIIRQESEFHTHAHSAAGAMGLMQLLYPTAKQLSKNLNIQLDETSLYDPKCNVTVGSYYISKLLERYEGNYILAIAAYNAGPHRVDKWIKLYGDPRKISDLNESVEWIEKIPYYETRTYVQHVLSNVQIYRNILDSRKKNSPLREMNIDLTRDIGRNSQFV